RLTAREYPRLMEAPPSPALSASQLATLAALGEEWTAGVGDVLYRLGDATYPFIAIREGEVAILDAAGNEIVRHGASGFLGELNRRSCGYRAAPSSSTPRGVRCCVRSGSDASWRRARRSTCSSLAAGPPALPPRSTAPPRGSTR